MSLWSGPWIRSRRMATLDVELLVHYSDCSSTSRNESSSPWKHARQWHRARPPCQQKHHNTQPASSAQNTESKQKPTDTPHKTPSSHQTRHRRRHRDSRLPAGDQSLLLLLRSAGNTSRLRDLHLGIWPSPSRSAPCRRGPSRRTACAPCRRAPSTSRRESCQHRLAESVRSREMEDCG